MPPKDLIEDIELSDEEFESLRGTLVVEQDVRTRNLIIACGLLSVLLISLLGWLIFFQAHTREELLVEALKEPKKIVGLARETAESIRRVNVSKLELMEAVSLATRIAATTMREPGHVRAPYLAVRQTAMVDALDGLMRLEIENFLDRRVPEDKEFLDSHLHRIGKLRVEYYENGVLERVPLLKSAFIQSEINDEMSSLGFVDERLVKNLEIQRDLALNEESYTVVSPVLLLGQWYRYYNDTERAQRCFHIGRKYIDGYQLGSKYYPGRVLKEISPLWDGYAACLEALTESAFASHKFRQARSYLMRLFRTPHSGGLTTFSRALSQQLELTKKELFSLDKDIDVLRRVISAPLTLPNFPFLHPQDSIIRWDKLIVALREANSNLNETFVVKYLLSHMNSGLRSKILTTPGTHWVNYPVKEQVTILFNRYVQDPTFYKNVTFDKELLSERGRNLLDRSETVSLSQKEYMFLNRDIIDAGFPLAITNQFALTDGTRINSSLDDEQVGMLVQLYQEEIFNTLTKGRRKDFLRREMGAIHRKEKRPILADLQTVLLDKDSYFKESILENERIFDAQRTVLQRVRQEMQELEDQGIVDVDRLYQLHSQEELAHSRQRQAKIRIKQSRVESDEISGAIKNLNKGFKNRLVAFEKRRERLLNRQSRLRDRTLSDRGPLVTQIEAQMALRKRYLSLLRGLKEQGHDQFLQELEETKVQNELEIKELRGKLNTLSGDMRESVEAELQILDAEKFVLVQEFDHIFEPLRSVVSAISAEESEVWKAEALLRETQSEIVEIIGTERNLGLLQEKARQRETLLLKHSNFVIEEGGAYGKEIRQLNDAIAGYHARLQVLLDTEKEAQAVLEAFFPFSGDFSSISLREGSFVDLHNYLREQNKNIADYNLLWQKNELYEEIFRNENAILENMVQVSEILGAVKVLSEVQVNDLSRFMDNILVSRKRLKRDRTGLKILDRHSLELKDLSRRDSDDLVSTGYYLDSVEMFQMEQKMGLNINEYRRVFEERKAIIQDLQVALASKQALEFEKVEAVRSRDQVQVDTLVPKIVDTERLIVKLSQEEENVNKHLWVLAQDYAENLKVAQAYRQDMKEEAVSIGQKVSNLQFRMIKNEKALKHLASSIYITVGKFNEAVTSLEVGDLEGVDELIEQQEKQLHHLEILYNVKRQENYYKAKALWLMGKSFYAQSQLNTIGKLFDADSISNEMLEDESRLGQLITEEFDSNFVYSEKMFGDFRTHDEENANFETWVNYLEESSMRIFHEELPKYVSLRDGSESSADYQGYKKQDNNVFIARARFLLGKTYLRRALRHVRASGAESFENKHALRELEAATRSFQGFIDFLNTLTNETRQQSQILTEPLFGSQEFPERVRRPVDLMDEAKIYLGILANLKNNSQEAINQYRTVLRHIIDDPLNELVEDHHDVIGQIDPIQVEEYQYDVGLYPHYAALLARYPLVHEVLYRLGRSYQKLADQEHGKTFDSMIPGGIKGHGNIDKFNKYSRQAIAYLSQLILTQSYSPFRRGALLQRSFLRRRLGDFENARQDLVLILGDIDNQGSSFDQSYMTSKGDLLGELDPGYSYVAFELGKLYFENRDYKAATEAFRMAQEGDPHNEHVIRSKIAYARSLMKMHSWLMAEYFLTQIVFDGFKEKEEYRHLYDANIILDLGTARKNLYNFENAITAYKEVFNQYAPEMLLTKDGDINLSSAHGLAILETDYRDAIRPIAMACYHIGEIKLVQRNYEEAKEYFRKAEVLFATLPWREDRMLRALTKEDYQLYRNDHILRAKWGGVKSNILDLLFGTFASYRRTVGRGIELGDVVDPEKILRQINIVMRQSVAQVDIYQEMADMLSVFYEQEKSRLPEVIEAERIRVLRDWDRKVGGKAVKRYDSLVGLRNFTLERIDLPVAKFVAEIVKIFPREGVEDKILNEFALEYATTLELTEKDREGMLPLNNNLDNLVAIVNSEERLFGFALVLQRWLEVKMRATGVDDIFLPVSGQARILEEIDLYRVSLLSFLDRFEHYEKMIEVVNGYLDGLEGYPSRVVDLQNLWLMTEMAAMAAARRSDWKQSARFHTHLLKPENKRFFVLIDKSDVYRAKLNLAKSLIKLGKARLAEVAFIQDTVDQEREEKFVQDSLSIARNHINEMNALEGQDAASITSRIRAKEMLAELEAL